MTLRRPTLAASAWALVACLGAGMGCGADAGKSGRENDALVPLDALSDARQTGLCTGNTPMLELGADHPFVAVTDPAAPKYPIQTGGQGAFHVEVSLRILGAFDPDHARIRLDLTRGDWAISSFINPDALLGVDAGVCSYDKIRLVLTDEQGGLLPEERTSELAVGMVHLKAEVDGAGLTAVWEGELTLSPYVSPSDAEFDGLGDASTDAAPSSH